jgi:thioredoxin 1
MGAGVLEVTADSFQASVLESSKPVLVDFWAPWCGPCRMLAPVIDQLAAEAGDKYVIAKLDTDKAQKVAIQYQISGIPTIIIFKGGQPVQRFMGIKSKAELTAALEAAAR